MQSYAKYHLDVREVIGTKQPQYVLHQGKEYTFDEYLALIEELNITQYEEDGVEEYEAAVNFLAEDKIVGSWWWFEFTAYCCSEPTWFYREHPSVGRDNV